MTYEPSLEQSSPLILLIVTVGILSNFAIFSLLEKSNSLVARSGSAFSGTPAIFSVSSGSINIPNGSCSVAVSAAQFNPATESVLSPNAQLIGNKRLSTPSSKALEDVVIFTLTLIVILIVVVTCTFAFKIIAMKKLIKLLTGLKFLTCKKEKFNFCLFCAFSNLNLL